MSIQDFIEHIRKQTGIPYLDVVCSQNNKQIFRYVSGENATGKERLRMYSCSKPITATAAARLIAEGKLGLDDAVCKYLPEVASAYVLDENGNKRVVGDKMTIRHLFTMSAGFTYSLSSHYVKNLARESDGKANLRDFISAFVQAPLAFAPGAEFRYSLCHDVLAAVIEVVMGQKFSLYIKEVVFDPLGMNDSSFDNSMQSDCVLYRADEEGKIAVTDEPNHLLPTPNYESGGAGLISTVDDYMKFANVLANGGATEDGYRLIDENVLKMLSTDHVGAITLTNNFTCVQGEDYGYGLGVRVRKVDTDWGLNAGEYGWDGAAGAYLLVDPNLGVSVVMGMHLMGWPTVFMGKHIEIVKRIYQEFFSVI